MAALSGPENPLESLEAIQSAVAAANAELYRHLALYLQVLRAVLQLVADTARVHSLHVRLADGSERAGQIARKTMDAVKDILGFVRH